MVEQSREPFLLPCLGYLPHTVQSLGHSFPALCRARVGLRDVLLGPRPSLPGFRRELLPLVRPVHRCRVGGGALARCPPSAAQTARTVFPYSPLPLRRSYAIQAP